jgi:hypothetical protein
LVKNRRGIGKSGQGGGDIYKNGRNNNKNLRISLGKRCSDIEKQNVEATTVEREAHHHCLKV